MEARSYQVIEIEPSGEEDSEGNDHEEGEEGGFEEDSFREEEVITSSEHSHSCTYLQYLTEWEEDLPPPLPQRQQRHYRINTSAHSRSSALELDEQSMQQLRRLTEEAGKVLLLGVLIGGMLLLSLQKRRKGKHSKSYLRRLWDRIWP